MSEITEYNGICLTCNNNVNCKFLKNHHSTIWQCEEYDGSTTTQSKNIYTEKLHKTRSETANTNHGNTATYKGLCVNCENREICSQEKTEGGIWHCENYE